MKGNRAYIGSGITDQFLGLRFSINGQVHYGWARISTRGNGTTKPKTIWLTGFACETNPNTTILAGDRGASALAKQSSFVGSTAATTPSLGSLSLGAVGLSAWRKEGY